MYKTFGERCFNKEQPFSINYWIEILEEVTGKEAEKRAKSHCEAGDSIPCGVCKRSVTYGPPTSERL